MGTTADGGGFAVSDNADEENVIDGADRIRTGGGTDRSGRALTADRPGHRREVPDWLAWLVAITWRVVFLALAAYLAVVALARVRTIVLPVIVALLITTILAPPARWLERRGLPPLAATWAVFLGAAAVAAGVVASIVPQVAGQASQLGDSLSETVEEARTWLVDGPLGLSEERLEEWASRAGEEFERNRDRLIGGALAGAVLVAEIIAGALIAVVLTFFFVKDGRRMWEWLLSQIHGDARRDLAAAGERAWSTLGNYIKGSTIDGLVEAALIAVVLLVLGVPLVLPLAILTFLGGYLPFVGAIVAGAAAASVALVSEGPFAALVVVAAAVVIQNIEGDVLQPLIMGKAVKLHPAVVLVSITAAATVAGLAGAFLAVPTVAVAVNVAGYFRHERPGVVVADEVGGSRGREDASA